MNWLGQVLILKIKFVSYAQIIGQSIIVTVEILIWTIIMLTFLIIGVLKFYELFNQKPKAFWLINILIQYRMEDLLVLNH